MATIYQFPVEKMEIDLSASGTPSREYTMSPLPVFLLEQARCTEEEKRGLIPLYIELLSLHYCYRDEGEDALLEEAPGMGQGFLKRAFSLFLTGMKAKNLEKQLLRIIKKSGLSGVRMMEALMIQQAVVSLAANNHPSITNELLMDLIGFNNPGSLLEVILNALSVTSSGLTGDFVSSGSCPSS